MGHDISGYNKAGKEIAYARFSMGNYNALELYRLLDAYEFYAGVSGNGSSTTFSLKQIEKAMDLYRQMYGEKIPAAAHWDQKQILDFVKNCLATAQKEGGVRISFF